MKRNPLALILVFTVILTGFTALPVRAGDKELRNFAVGAIGLFILGNIISDSKKKNKQSDVSRGYYTPDVITPAYNAPSYKKSGHKNNNRHKKANKNLPESCFFNLRTPYGPRGVYGKKCLDESMRHANRLPQTCQDNVRIRHGRRADVFTARCLNKHGYRTASNHRR